MSDNVIRVQNLGKKYQIKHQAERQRYTALRDILAARGKSLVLSPWSLVRRLFRSRVVSGPVVPSSRASQRASREDFWALKDVSFEVKRGEVMGWRLMVIGR